MVSVELSDDVDLREHWRAIAIIGGLTGILSGLLGIGGAAILVPGMVDVLGVSQHRATGTSLFTIIPTAVVAAVVYAFSAQIDLSLVVLFSATAVLGATLGARATSRVSAANLRRLFGLFLLLVAIRLLVPSDRSDPGLAAVIDLRLQDPTTTLAEGALGLVAGFFSGLLGIGGGQILTPGMVFLFDVPQKLAQGISIAFIVPTAVSGAVTHYRRGNVLPRLGLALVPCSMLGGAVGALAAQVVDAHALRFGFGLFLVYGSIRMLAPHAVNLAVRRVSRRV